MHAFKPWLKIMIFHDDYSVGQIETVVNYMNIDFNPKNPWPSMPGVGPSIAMSDNKGGGQKDSKCQRSKEIDTQYST